MNKDQKKIFEYIENNIILSNKRILSNFNDKSIIVVDGSITLYFTIKNDKVVFLSPLKN
ncbi:hypothetical protein [Clostridium baratii]|uniref:hypothetical protein n=1 Tax=Clostridium baratii TaxID=1561 RepID=UPI0030CFB94A